MPTAVTLKPTILKLSYLKFYPPNAGNCELRNSWQPTRGLNFFFKFKHSLNNSTALNRKET